MNKFIIFLIFTGAALAHPHVTVEYKTTVVVTEGKVMAIKHQWQFDQFYTAYVLAGQGDKKDGKPTDGELAKLAKNNIENLDEFGYFTKGSLNKIKLAFDKPKEEKMALEKEALTLSFTLPLRSPILMEHHDFHLDIFDPSFFVAFQPASGEFIKVEGTGCKIDYKPPQQSSSSLSKLGESFFDTMSSNFTKDYVGSIVVSCR